MGRRPGVSALLLIKSRSNSNSLIDKIFRTAKLSGPSKGTVNGVIQSVLVV